MKKEMVPQMAQATMMELKNDLASNLAYSLLMSGRESSHFLYGSTFGVW